MTFRSYAVLFAALALAPLAACQKAKPAAPPAAALPPSAPVWARLELPELSGTPDLSADRARVSACLVAASAAKTSVDGCIGAVAEACRASGQDPSPAGVVGCLDRETAAWGSILGETEKNLAAKSAELTAATGKAHAAFLADREAQCLLPYVINEGGTDAHLFAAECANDLTARQVLRLRAQAEIPAQTAAQTLPTGPALN